MTEHFFKQEKESNELFVICFLIVISYFFPVPFGSNIWYILGTPDINMFSLWSEKFKWPVFYAKTYFEYGENNVR